MKTLRIVPLLVLAFVSTAAPLLAQPDKSRVDVSDLDKGQKYTLAREERVPTGRSGIRIPVTSSPCWSTFSMSGLSPGRT